MQQEAEHGLHSQSKMLQVLWQADQEMDCRLADKQTSYKLTTETNGQER